MNEQLIKMPAPDPRYYFNVRPLSQSDMIVVREIWSENVYEVADGDFADTGIVIDIGANIGAFTLFAAKMGAKKVIAVEPEPHNIELLRMNIAENKKHSDCEFIVEADAIGGKEGVAYITPMHGDSRIHGEDERLAEMAKVNVITLDMLFGKYGLEYIDVLKIDIEGLEGEVIAERRQSHIESCVDTSHWNMISTQMIWAQSLKS
jgi:FkbM family methyltransferase